MHTFFINTSGKELENYSDIFEIQHETRRLVSLECPLAEWNDKEKGYEACVHKMGELIDSYKDINNDFNLIIYVDLLSYEKYTSIPMNEHRERYACLKALRAILKHYINCTIVNKIKNTGRSPQEILLIFEENQLPKDKDEKSEDGKNLIRKYVKEFLGFPSECEKIDRILYNGENEERVTISPEQFCAEMTGFGGCFEGEKVLCTYLDLIDTFISEAKGYDTSEQPVMDLCDRIIDCSDMDDRDVSSITFVTNRHAGIVNKQENTRRNLRLCFYILACVEDETFFDKTLSGKDGSREIKQFPEINWEEVVEGLIEKASAFKLKYSEIQGLSESFSEKDLAPSLKAFNNKRFALEECGKKEKSFEVVDEQEQQGADKENEGTEEDIVRSKDKKTVVVSEVQRSSLFSEDEYPAFDYLGDDYDDSILSSDTTAEQYVAAAKELRQHHLDYLHRLKVHVSDRLSNYAGRSAENDPALLGKRKVSVAEEDFEDPKRDYRYAQPNVTDETKKLKTVETIAETAYTSVLLDYMEFCAGRSVAVTDIEEQCNWFVTKVYQIKESLRKIKLVAISLLFAIIALYIPFVVLQWEGITENIMTIITALMSVAVPVVLLYVVFVAVYLYQRKKYRVAWKEFKDKSRQILEENADSAEKYDKLLSVYVPTLRWIYEYKLDVGFYAECCKMARAKISHHVQKLHDRVVTIGNIIEDLETNLSEREVVTAKAQSNSDSDIDYNVSFCSGRKNRKFYSIIDTNFLKSIHK